MGQKLTKRAVDAMRASRDRVYVFDDELPGFGVAVHSSGLKTFFVQYRVGRGRRAEKRRVAIGRYGPLTVEQARAAARDTLADVTRGQDPAAERAARKGAPTVSELGVAFLDDVEARRKTRTANEYRRLWEKHVLPAIGTRKVADVAPAQVAALHRQLRSTPYVGNRTLALVGSFFTYAERQDMRPRHSNPAHDIEPYPEHSRERFLSQAEVARLGEALTRAATMGLPPAPTRRRERKTGPTAKHLPKTKRARDGSKIPLDQPTPANPFAIAAIRFLLLTGWREQEVLTLQWSAVDVERGVATLQDTKTGRSVRAIGAPARLLLTQLPRLHGSPYVFPGRDSSRPLVEINRVWYAVRHAAKLDDVRLHDLRHSFASVIASSGGSLLLIGKLLGHKDTATTAKYAHLFDDPVRAAADATSAQLAAWLEFSSAARKSADVTPITRSRRNK